MRSRIIKSLIVAAMVTAVVTTSALLALSATENGTKRMAGASGNNRFVRSAVYETGDPDACIVAYNQYNLIRLHVVANSDSDRDQALKRRVRDLIVDRMTPEFRKAGSLDEARAIAGSRLKEIEKIARKEISNWGESYPVNASLGRFDFPIKNYGELTLPAGKYEAVRVVIGEGQGANWWCVLFPPLCLVDVSKGMSPETPDTAQAVYTDEDFSRPEVHDIEVKHVETQDLEAQDVVIRFKILELLGLDVF